ncbi:MAG: hypothetical protein ACK4IS_07245 [Erythrobacter sp.]
MGFAVVRLFFSGAFERVLKGLSAASKWLLAAWWRAPLILFGLGFAVMAFIRVPALEREIATLSAERDAERSANAGTVNAFIAATHQAQAEAEANAARVAREQEIITDAISRDHSADLAALSARYERLLQSAQRAAIHSGSAGAAGVPGLPGAASPADAASGQDRLPATGVMALDDAFTASVQALQLDALIDWIERQQAVRFTPEPQP